MEAALSKSCSSWRGAHSEAGELGTYGDTCGAALERWAPWYRAMSEQFLKSCSLQEAHQDQLGRDCILWKGSHVGVRVEGDHKGPADTMHYGLVATPISHSPAALGVRK